MIHAENSRASNTLAIFAGGGRIPKRVAELVTSQGRSVFIIGMKEVTDPSLSLWPHAWWEWGQVGLLFKLLKSNHCSEVVAIGTVRRPHIKDVKFDMGAFTRLPRILSMLAGGDGDVLHAMIKYTQENGVAVVGAHEVAPELCLTEEFLGKQLPGRDSRKDILKGLEIARAIGGLDIGQGVIVESGRVIAVEAAEGTDAMITRSAEFRLGKKHGRTGVLVKVPKPGQDLRVDMPTIGVKTIECLASAGFAGIAVERGHTLVADKDEVRAAADAAGIFVSTVPQAN